MVQDKLWLPGLLKLKMLRDSGFFGRILSVRGEFGYWVFEGDRQPAQRPSWNYRKEDGGGIIVDMLCHWRYVLDNLFGEVKAVSCLGATHIPERWDEDGKQYKAPPTTPPTPRSSSKAASSRISTARGRRACAATTCSRCRSTARTARAVAGLRGCRIQARVNTPQPVWNPDIPQPIDFFDGWQEVPDNATYDNAFKAQWELFLRHVAGEGDVPLGPAGRRQGRAARRARAARAGSERRWLDVPPLKA